MRSATRHQLKQNQFATTAGDTVHWAVDHRNTLLYGILGAAILLAVGIGVWFYNQNRDEQASLRLGDAMRTYQAPLRPGDAPASPTELSFTSAKQRADAAIPKLRAIAEQYSSTRTGALSRYLLGLSMEDSGDNAAAEGQLKQVADSRHTDLSALAKMALASLYRQTNREQQAIQIYKELIDKPTNTVAKPTAQLELAGLYSAKDPGEARRVYDQVAKENPNTQAATLANTRMASLK